MSEKSMYHERAERIVKGVIKNDRDSYEHIGREHDPKVAEKMAYAAKPLIDSAMESLELKPNSEGMATFTLPDGSKTFNKEPGVVDEDGHEFSYREIAGWAHLGHEAANDVQVEHYDKLVRATELRRQADRLEREAAEV